MVPCHFLACSVPAVMTQSSELFCFQPYNPTTLYLIGPKRPIAQKVDFPSL